jgi:hypothetical protein
MTSRSDVRAYRDTAKRKWHDHKQAGSLHLQETCRGERRRTAGRTARSHPAARRMAEATTTSTRARTTMGTVPARRFVTAISCGDEPTRNEESDEEQRRDMVRHRGWPCLHGPNVYETVTFGSPHGQPPRRGALRDAPREAEPLVGRGSASLDGQLACRLHRGRSGEGARLLAGMNGIFPAMVRHRVATVREIWRGRGFFRNSAPRP